MSTVSIIAENEIAKLIQFRIELPQLTASIEFVKSAWSDGFARIRMRFPVKTVPLAQADPTKLNRRWDEINRQLAKLNAAGLTDERNPSNEENELLRELDAIEGELGAAQMAEKRSGKNGWARYGERREG